MWAFNPSTFDGKTTEEWGGGGVEGVNLILPGVFQKMYLLKERVKTCYFRTFNIIISHIFPENVIESPQIVQKI